MRQHRRQASHITHRVIITLILVVISTDETLCQRRGEIRLKMPDVRPDHDESYLCMSHRLNENEPEYIVGFQPDASASKVHHILLYGCSAPAKLVRDTPNYVWECGEMNRIDEESATPVTYDFDQVCAANSKSTILFGWALNAPAIELPPQVGFKVGGSSDISFLVLQVHYGRTDFFKQDPQVTDNSGLILEIVSGPNHGITKQAGIYILLSYGFVPEGLSRHNIECSIDEDLVIHPFRFRTHTHKLGLLVAAYKLSQYYEPALIGEHNPQEPQMFYPVENTTMTITRGDRIHAFCDYNNARGRSVFIGATGNDEMCNFYMMYWVEGDRLLNKQDCNQYNPHS